MQRGGGSTWHRGYSGFTWRIHLWMGSCIYNRWLTVEWSSKFFMMICVKNGMMVPKWPKKICCSVEKCWNHQSIFCCKWKYVPVGYCQCTKGWLIVLGRLNVKPGWIHPKQIGCRGVEICISPIIIGLVQGKIDRKILCFMRKSLVPVDVPLNPFEWHKRCGYESQLLGVARASIYWEKTWAQHCSTCSTTLLCFVSCSKKTSLVVWNMNFLFPYFGNFIIPTDELICFRGVGQPPTRNQTKQRMNNAHWSPVWRMA